MLKHLKLLFPVIYHLSVYTHEFYHKETPTQWPPKCDQQVHPGAQHRKCSLALIVWAAGSQVDTQTEKTSTSDIDIYKLFWRGRPDVGPSRGEVYQMGRRRLPLAPYKPLTLHLQMIKSLQKACWQIPVSNYLPASSTHFSWRLKPQIYHRNMLQLQKEGELNDWRKDGG